MERFLNDTNKWQKKKENKGPAERCEREQQNAVSNMLKTHVYLFSFVYFFDTWWLIMTNGDEINRFLQLCRKRDGPTDRLEDGHGRLKICKDEHKKQKTAKNGTQMQANANMVNWWPLELVFVRSGRRRSKKRMRRRGKKAEDGGGKWRGGRGGRMGKRKRSEEKAAMVRNKDTRYESHCKLRIRIRY